MHARFSLIAVSGLVLLAIATGAPCAWAQAGVDIFVTPIPNLPFTGVINGERSFVQRDGSIVNVKTIRDIGRDGRGRIYNESRMLVPVANTKTPQLMQFIDTTRRPGSLRYSIPKTELSQQERLVTRPQRYPPLFSMPHPWEAVSRKASSQKRKIWAFMIWKDCQCMEFAKLRLSRQRTAAPARKSVITDEYWYSDDLRINLIIKHSDPRTGSVTMTVTQVIRTEPDSARFEIPDGYKPTGTGRETDK